MDKCILQQIREMKPMSDLMREAIDVTPPTTLSYDAVERRQFAITEAIKCTSMNADPIPMARQILAFIEGREAA